MANPGNSTGQLRRRLRLRDLVLSQILCIVGSSWVGVAAALGHGFALTWIAAMLLFYVPATLTVYRLNRVMPIEGGLYSWARLAIGNRAGFLVAWNLWVYGTIIVVQILYAIPTEVYYLVGPSAQWLPENRAASTTLIVVLLLLICSAAIRGLTIVRWIHNLGGVAILLVYAVLILLPLWAALRHIPMHWQILPMATPPINMVTLALFGQLIFGALCGSEYPAILAGEAENPGTAIGKSVTVAGPIICLMFILGTSSVVTFSRGPIDLIAPVPQTLRLALGRHGLGASLAIATMLLLQIRVLAAASLLFTGITRLPMTVGWDHLLPEWLSRLDPRYATPRNAICLTTGMILILLLIFSTGVHSQEAFQLFSNASIVHYQLAYLAMFSIPSIGARHVRRLLPPWLKWVSALGFCATLFAFLFAAYPFVEVVNRGAYSLKILGTVCLSNLAGFCFYGIRSRSREIKDASDTVGEVLLEDNPLG